MQSAYPEGVLVHFVRYVGVPRIRGSYISPGIVGLSLRGHPREMDPRRIWLD